MIVTDKFVFVHLPRSGGTFVTGVIRKFFPSAHEIGHHLQRELLPKEYSHLPVLGTVLCLIVSLRVAQRCRKRIGLLDERERKARI
jgi:hypothetical protein